MCFATRSCASFCQGIRRYSFRIIFIRSSQSFHASLDTWSKMRCPSSPGHGGASRPGSSFWNFTHMTLRPLVFVDGDGAAEGPQESAMEKIVVDLRRWKHGEIRIDREAKPRVRRAKGRFHRIGVRRAREDEAQITRPFRQRHEQLIDLRRDVKIDDP